MFPSSTTTSRTDSLTVTSRFCGQRVHFIGIGGCGMSGLAAVLLDAGSIITGSDPSPNEQTFALAKRGIKITRDQLGELLSREVDLVVRTAAVPDTNPEFLAAKKLGLPTMKYAQLLGQVMAERLGIAVAGTHGKTTTSAMIAHALKAAGADPSYVIGGTVPQLGGSSASGGGAAFVVEACEYDRSFHHLRPRIAVINNIEADHLDCYRDLADIQAAFRTFAQLVPADGLVLANGGDAPTIEALAHLDRKIEWVGVKVGCASARHSESPEPLCAEAHPTMSWFSTPTPAENGCYRGVVYHDGAAVAQYKLQVPGLHNAFNATVAIAAATAAGTSPQAAADAISAFTGVDRRMTMVGHCNGALLIDDYGHHPTEICATLGALRQRYTPARLICVFQPHQHSRTRTLMDEFAGCFEQADLVIIPDIYSVRDSEEEKRLTSSRDLVDRVNAYGQAKKALHIGAFADVVCHLRTIAKPGDLILTIGAGPVCDIGKELKE